MGAKRALIVDDSKSARLFLARALEKYDIDVDSAESAEAAIDYLIGNRPDVIFMDHLMPGMDGLQAVQAIKNDPRTATIPIMMYTSQEGELYLGQARALGALGVLPKQIKPADVSKVLYQLHLVPDRRNPEQGTFTPASVPAAVAMAAAAQPAAGEAPGREHLADLRRALLDAVDAQTGQIVAEVRALLREALPPPAAEPGVATTPTRDAPTPWSPWLVRVCLGITALSLLVAAAGLLAWYRSAGQLRDLSARRAAPVARTVAAASGAGMTAGGPGSATRALLPNAAAASDPAGDTRPVVLPVPYGADAFGGARLEAIRQVLARLQHQKVNAVVELRSYPGRFCLTGNAVDGYSPAPEETLFNRCDLVGNPLEDSLSVVQRTSLPLVNLIGAVRAATHGALQIQTSSGDPGAVLVAYPPSAPDLTAGAWNRAAAANNRLEIRVR